MSLSDLAQRFSDRFKGLERGHGTYDLSKPVSEGDKKKGRAMTVQRPLTLADWENHLAGTVGIGIVPIRDDGTVVWGAIDIDTYNLDLIQLSIKLNDSPLLVCRSKSGGAHIFCFTSEPVPARLMQERLARAAAAMGYGGVEIFPKQTELLTDRGDVGNWLNMPYFGGESSSRYCILNGDGVDPEAFLTAASGRQITLEQLRQFTLVDESEYEAYIPDGPPCLQIMCRNGITAGGRNNALMAIGVYLKMAHPDDWRTRIEEYNRRVVSPPLDAGEVLMLVRSLEKKAYHYTCDKEPLASYCDKRTCVKRKYGVRGGEGGDEVDFPMIGGLTKIETFPPIWFLDVEGHRMGPMSTEDLQLQPRFQRVCIEQINRMPPQLKPNKWNQLINALLASVQTVEMPDDSSDAGLTWQHLEKFCTGRAQCSEFEELLVSDKPFTDDVNGLTYFKLQDFITYLERRRFKNMTPQQLAVLLRERGAQSERRKIKGKDVTLWIIPRFETTDVTLSAPSFENNDF